MSHVVTAVHVSVVSDDRRRFLHSQQNAQANGPTTALCGRDGRRRLSMQQVLACACTTPCLATARRSTRPYPPSSAAHPTSIIISQPRPTGSCIGPSNPPGDLFFGGVGWRTMSPFSSRVNDRVRYGYIIRCYEIRLL